MPDISAALPVLVEFGKGLPVAGGQSLPLIDPALTGVTSQSALPESDTRENTSKDQVLAEDASGQSSPSILIESAFVPSAILAIPLEQAKATSQSPKEDAASAPETPPLPLAAVDRSRTLAEAPIIAKAVRDAVALVQSPISDERDQQLGHDLIAADAKSFSLPVGKWGVASFSPAAPLVEKMQPDVAHDVARMIDNLALAREILSPRTGQLIVQHAEFGRVSLQFDANHNDMLVTISGADPDLQRAMAATPLDNRAGQGEPKDSPGQQSMVQGQMRQQQDQGSQRHSADEPAQTRQPPMAQSQNEAETPAPNTQHIYA